MSANVVDKIGVLVRRVSGHLNQRLSDLIVLLLRHKSAGSLGAIAGFAIAVVFAWRFMRSPRGRGRRNQPKRRAPPSSSRPSADGSASSSLDGLASLAEWSASDDIVEARGAPVELTLNQVVRKKLGGCRKMTCQLLGVVLEEKTPQELQEHATVRPSVLEVLLEISKHCDVYLMETVLDDESEERVLSALESAGLFEAGILIKEKVLFCGTDVGRTSFVRQLEADWHVDTSLDIITQLSRFIRYQLYISELEALQLAHNVFTSVSLEKHFS